MKNVINLSWAMCYLW